MEELLNMKEVCQILGCEDEKGRYVRDLVKKGYIVGAKFGNRWMFKKSSIDEFIEHQFTIQNFK